jgi:LPS sulfotransferase NodH
LPVLRFLGNKTLPGGEEQTSDNQIAFLRKFFRNYKTADRHDDTFSRGFKVMAKRADPQILAVGRYAKVVEEYDLCKYFLYRRNRVKQIVSALRAAQVQQVAQELKAPSGGHVFDNQLHQAVSQLPPLTINPKEFDHRLNGLEASYRVLDHIKAKMTGTREIYYEDMLIDRQAFFNQVFKDIGVDPIDVTQNDEVKKITSNDLRNVIANFDELLTFFKDKQYYNQLLEK